MTSELQKNVRELFLLSVLSLFAELLVIRWLATEIRMFAYFKNMPLLAAFLGLSLGFLWASKKKDWLTWSGIGFLYLIMLLIGALALGLSHLAIVDPAVFLFMGHTVQSEQARVSLFDSLKNLSIVLAIFAFTASIFIGFGQRMGQLFTEMRPLTAYSINVFGSLVGSLMFSLLSLSGAGPGSWLITAGFLFVLVRKKIAHFMIIIMGILYPIWLQPFITEHAFGKTHVLTAWSPYYRIDIGKAFFKEKEFGYNVLVNYDSLQSMLDNRPESIARFDKKEIESAFDFYELMYKYVTKPNPRVLILGAGTGNDAANALRHGASHVDAIEIDPMIIRLGKQLHPEQAYRSPKVNVYCMDARTFLKNSREKYDLIIFAFLDSHTAFSSLSSLRLDNYIFTKEALEEAAKLLAPDGILSVSFNCQFDWMWNRYSKLVHNATGMMPIGLFRESVIDVGLFVAGPGLKPIKPDFPEAYFRKASIDNDTPISTDDWPFLFLPKREVGLQYALPVLAAILIGLLAVGKEFKSGLRQRLNWQMFGLGMGFMLLEVRAMADLSLLFGSTWVVNSVIISGVMIAILAANFIASRTSTRHIPVICGLLILSLIATTLINVGEFSKWGPALGGTVAAIIYLFPLMFSGTMFGLFFKNVPQSNVALAYNLVGGMVGVCLEYLSMALGVRALGWIAVAIYSCVLASSIMGGKSNPEPAPDSQATT